MITVKFKKTVFDEDNRILIADFSSSNYEEMKDFESKNQFIGINFDSEEVINNKYTVEAGIIFEYGAMESIKNDIKEAIKEFNNTN